jgi:hypothetical protein
MTALGGLHDACARLRRFASAMDSEADLQRQYYTWGLGLMAFVGKHLRGSIEYKDRFRALARWWTRDQLRQLKASLRGRHPLPPRMILADRNLGRRHRHLGGVQALVRTHRTHPWQSLMITEHRWEVRQINLEEALPGMETETGAEGVYLQLWWRSLPLGHLWSRRELLPIRPNDLRLRVARAIAPAVGNYLFPIGFRPPLPTIADNPARHRHPAPLRDCLRRSPPWKITYALRLTRPPECPSWFVAAPALTPCGDAS